MLVIRMLCSLLVLSLAAVVAQAKSRILIIRVYDLQNQPVPGIKINLREPGCVVLSPTDIRGVTRIKLATNIKPGMWVTMELSNSRYAFIQPWNQLAQVPSFENESANFVQVFVVGKGNYNALKSG